jgi:GTP-binding protein
MIIKQAEFAASCANWNQLPEDELPEIALAGRSNVGKSSLINRMLNRKQLARTSSVPGKTRTLNFYRINGELYFVDFPGYGYAKTSRGERRKWGKLIERYLLERKQLKLLLLLIDIRHPPTRDDQAMYEWAVHHGIPVCLVATKADKISRSRQQQHTAQIRKTLQISGEVPVIPFSSETGAGREELWERIAAAAK